MTIDMSQFYQVFFEESAELLGEMERLLLVLDVGAPSKDDLNAIFRTAHSIKGGAGTFGFTEIVDTTHILESLLDKLRNNELTLRQEMVDVFLVSIDVLKMQLAGQQYGSEIDQTEVQAICKRLSALAEGSDEVAVALVNVPAASGTLAWAEKVEVSTSSVAVEKEPARMSDDGIADPEPENLYRILMGAQVVESQQSLVTLPIKSQIAAPTKVVPAGSFGFFDDEPTPTPAPVPAVQGVQSVAAVTTAMPTPKAETEQSRRATDVGQAVTRGRRASDRAESAEATSIRVGVEKVDQLINLVGELVITQAMLAQAATKLDPVLYESVSSGLAILERNTRDLQESVMSIRMMPISFVFSRFPRVVHDLANKLNKQVELKTVGEGTELDKGLIEKIADPLNHLVRNSLDHGLETPEKRMAAGKDPKGTITLSASHHGGNILVEVTDDGGGLNREKILAKAKERGLSASDEMSDQEVWKLIFEPGFSTADVVTDVSGRGVGMDVVRRNIHGMGGSIEIASQLGVGTSISIRLPLTLAILDGMSVGVGNEVFIIPLTYIIESLQPNMADIRSIGGQSTVIQVRGEYLPVISLHDKFKIASDIVDMSKGIMVILETEGSKTALFVEAILGQHQVVIKSLETNYRKTNGISGATIMGDGRVALILDAAALARQPKDDLQLAA